MNDVLRPAKSKSEGMVSKEGRFRRRRVPLSEVEVTILSSTGRTSPFQPLAPLSLLLLLVAFLPSASAFAPVLHSPTTCHVAGCDFYAGSSFRRRYFNRRTERIEELNTRTHSSTSTSFAASIATNPTPSSDRPISSRNSKSNKRYKKKRFNPQNHKRQVIRQLFRRAQTLERKGLWRKAAETLHEILAIDHADAHSHLALARLEARRAPDTDRAVQAFSNGTTACPNSIHLWQAWAVHEESHGRIPQAQHLFERALQIDPANPYVCHAYGRMLEQRQDETDQAHALWKQALAQTSTAALVCSLGASLVAQKKYQEARELYAEHVDKLKTDREKTEVNLAASWLEERYFSNFDLAEELIQRSLQSSTRTNSLAQVALARLEGRRRQQQQRGRGGAVDKEAIRQATVRKLAEACDLESKKRAVSKDITCDDDADGRVFNAWASMEVKAKRLTSAKKILRRGLERFPRDFSLLQAAGKVEERMGNYTEARKLYRSSLRVQPSAPCLVSYALLELRQPQFGKANFPQVKRMFEEALLLDPRHGPAYNAYARCVFEREDEVQAREIFERGVRANCPDAASLYHGYAKLELALGNVSRARELLLAGRREAARQDIGKDSPHRERALFLTHTLGMLELNSNNPKDALEVFSDGLERYGNYSQLLLGAALCEVRLGNVEKARLLFEKSVLHDETHAHAWQAWGVMEMRAGNFETAKTLFECGIKTAPRHGPLWQAYAIMESRMGNVTEARVLFEKGILHAPNHVSLYQGWASMELREGHNEAAKVLITQALTRDKRNGGGWLIASAIESGLGNEGLATLLLRRGIECCPTDASLFKALGDSMIGQSKFNEAREIYERGIDVDPLHAPSYHALAELEARVFNIEGLAKLNKRAAAVFQTNALETPAGSSEAWASKIKAGRQHSVPREVTALAEKIAEEDTEAYTGDDVDPSSFLDRMSSNLMEDGLVSNLLNMDGHEGLNQDQL